MFRYVWLLKSLRWMTGEPDGDLARAFAGALDPV